MATQITMENAEGNILDIPSAGIERRGQIDIIATNGFFRVDRYDGANHFTHDFLKSHSLTGSGALVTGNSISESLWTVVENAEKIGSLLRYICPEDGDQAINKYRYSYINNNTGSLQNDSASVTKGYAEGVDSNYPQLNMFEKGPATISVAGTSITTLRMSGAYNAKVIQSYGTSDTHKLIMSLYIEDDNYEGLHQDNGDWNQLFSLGRCLWVSRDKFVYRDMNGDWQHTPFPNNVVIPAQRWVTIEADLIKASKTTRTFETVLNLKIGDIDLSQYIFNAIDNETSYISLRNSKYYRGDNAESILRFSPVSIFAYDNAVSLIGEDGANEYYNILKAYTTPDNNAQPGN